ncbi:MAG: hypothetical protein KGD67_12130 [Candidatus Lokiarchaeota archaeon]|nr:hypothetical protein [Candidatus Lokiarchaeota archaeon]
MYHQLKNPVTDRDSFLIDNKKYTIKMGAYGFTAYTNGFQSHEAIKEINNQVDLCCLLNQTKAIRI